MDDYQDLVDMVKGMVAAETAKEPAGGTSRPAPSRPAHAPANRAATRKRAPNAGRAPAR